MLDGRVAVLYPAAQDVARRKVFYVSGFDPLGARRYRELYRKEGPRQGAAAGYTVKVRGKQRVKGANYAWRVVHREDGRKTVSEFEFLGWDDIVRHSIRPSLSYVYGLMFRTLWTYLSSGAIRSMWRLRSGPLIAGLVPAALMIFYLVYATMIAVFGWPAGGRTAGPAGAGRGTAGGRRLGPGHARHARLRRTDDDLLHGQRSGLFRARAGALSGAAFRPAGRFRRTHRRGDPQQQL